MSIPYMPLYVTDYDADTAHLTPEEDGIYCRLLRLCWRTPGCSVPDDPKWVARKLRVDGETYERTVEPIIDEFFQREKGRVFSKRLSAEHERINDTHKKRVKAGKKGGQSNKSLKNKESYPKPGFSKTKARPKQPEPEPEPDITALKARAGGFKNFKGLSDLLCEAAGLTDETKSPGHLSLADPLRWIENGCDLEADILPAIRSTAAAAKARGTKITSWGYFNDPVFEARDRRLAPVPVSPIRQQSHSRPVSVAEAAMRKVQGQ